MLMADEVLKPEGPEFGQGAARVDGRRGTECEEARRRGWMEQCEEARVADEAGRETNARSQGPGGGISRLGRI